MRTIRNSFYKMNHSKSIFSFGLVSCLSKMTALSFFTLLTVASSACQKNPPQDFTPLSPIAERGKSIYRTQCIACHNTDPRKSGSLGPEVFGASKELIEARVMRAEYPPGYQPKRTTKTMGALPHLKGELEAIHAYLNSSNP